MNVCAHKIGTARCTKNTRPRRTVEGGYCRTIDYPPPYSYDIRWCSRGPGDAFDAQVRDFWPGRVHARNGWY